MALLEVENLRFKYKDEELFNSVNFRILENDHIVILGDNGTGKTTFLNIICSKLSQDSGIVRWLNNVTYSYLDQHLDIKDDITINEYLLKSYEKLFDIEKKMNEYYNLAATSSVDKMDRFLEYANSLSLELEKNDFYNIDAKIKNVLVGLGLIEYDLDTKLKILSSGTKMKVFLAKMLLDSADVLILDEPTNFLDEAHIDFLISYLKNYKKQFVVVSHDEKFVKPIARVIYNLKNKELIRYNMDYDHYLIEKEVREDNYKKAYNKQQDYIKKTNEFIAKNIVRATTTKRAQSRRKMLEKIKVLEKPKEDEVLDIKFPFSTNLGQDVLFLDDLKVGYGNKVVLNHITFLLEHNKKVAILGKNGIGKTTIIKTIMDVIPKLGGSYKWTDSSMINYFKQEETFDDNLNAINYLRYYYHLKTDGELRSVLAKFGIKGELAIKPISELSGGEQTRVRLALMSMNKSNILVLDEPTNHLDMNTKAYLWQAIYDFPGSVILVTHEDDFYDGLVDIVLNFE